MSTNETPTLGQNIRELRIANRYSYRQFAKIMEVCTATILKWEKSETFPDAKEIDKMVSILGRGVLPRNWLD